MIGLPPTAEQLEQFASDNAANKREKLVDALLADKQGYAENWMAFWNDLLRNDEQTNIDGLRKPITPWLYRSLLENKPLDQFTAELLDPGKDGPDGYLKGVNWRGRVNASQTPPVQAAQNVSQVFLASSIKCASCHDSFINDWKLEQAYGMASFFSPQNLEMARCDKPTGKIVAPKFLFPDLGDVDPKADGPTRLKAVATMVTRPKNPRFARTMVNRLWKRLMGRGLFEPADDFDGKAPADALLDWLAYDFMAHDYDAKHTLKLILLSKVYQLPAVKAPAKRKETPLLIGPTERRLTSEQYLDSVSMLTGYWPKVDVMNVKVDDPNIRAWRHRKPDNLALALGRPTREQVCTQRDEESTVLQALELVNGAAMSHRLREGAKALLASDLGREEDAAKVGADAVPAGAGPAAVGRGDGAGEGDAGRAEGQAGDAAGGVGGFPLGAVHGAGDAVHSVKPGRRGHGEPIAARSRFGALGPRGSDAGAENRPLGGRDESLRRVPVRRPAPRGRPGRRRLRRLPSLVRGTDGGTRSDHAAHGGEPGPAPGGAMSTEVVLKTLKHVWTHLEPLRLPMAVMGGLALSMWRYPRATRDVDLLVNVEASNVDAVLKVLQDAGMRLKRHPPVLQLGSFRLAQLLYEPPGTFVEAQVDLLLADSEYPKQALARRVRGPACRPRPGALRAEL